MYFLGAALRILAISVILSALPAAVRADGKVPPINTVFIILEENEDWKALTPEKAPYLNGLLKAGAHATQYYNPPRLHPSLPNYIWLEAGDNLGIVNNNNPDMNHQDTRDHLVAYLETAGLSWKSYQEDIPGTECPLTPVNRYVPRHNPMVYFDDVTDRNHQKSAKCIEHIRPYAELEADLRNNTVARYNFITPNLCNDMHDCSTTHGDTWLAAEVPKILSSEAYKNGGALIITFDEGEGTSDGPIGMVVVSPYARAGYSNSIRYDHSSTLRTMQEIFGLKPLLRGAASARSLSDLFLSEFSFDSRRPAVSLAASRAENGRTTVKVSASDNVGVVKTELYLDGELTGSLRYPPYDFHLTGDQTPSVEHLLTAKAYDAAGNSAVSATARMPARSGE